MSRPHSADDLLVRAAALDALADGVCITDPEGRIVHVNPGFTTIAGWAPEQILGRSVELFHAGELQAGSTGDASRPGGAMAQAGTVEWTCSRADGDEFLARVTVSPLPGGGAVLVIRDITEFRRRSSSVFRTLVDGSPDGIAVHREGRLVYANPAFAHIVGAESADDLVGDRVGALDVSETTERSLLRGDGSSFDAELTPLPFLFEGESAVLVMVRDLSERRQVETRQRETDRMVAIGTLAAGIAHEINTPVQFISDSASFLRTAFEDLEPLLRRQQALAFAAEDAGFATDLVAEVRAEEQAADLPYLLENVPKAIARAVDGAGRVASIVRAMKEFGHPGGVERAPADLEAALRATVTVARNEWKYVADVELAIDPLPPVCCHISLLNQVFLNLLVNAAHALGDREARGHIRISATCEGEHVHVRVADDGAGIPESVRGRVFDPFFTTKPVGKGTGQGLAIAKSIVVGKHGGRIWFDTETGRGTTFHVLIPVGGPS